jgi:glycosyltransferase involved in cell wall biosynthesis
MRQSLLFVGKVRDCDYLHECLKAGGEFVRYVGYLGHEDPLLRSAYRACEVFVLPSLLETPGLAALEAAAQGAKIVITEVGAARDYFESYAEYVDPASEASVERAIRAQLARRPAAELPSHILDNFTWSHAAKTLIDAYERVLFAAPNVN